MKKIITRQPKNTPIVVSTKSNYDKDLNKWALQQTQLLKQKDFSKLDLVNLIEEVEDLSGSLRRALRSHLIRLLMHLLKYRHQPKKQENSNSWRHSILNSRREIKLLIDESPSLQSYLEEKFSSCYEDARKDASLETDLPLKNFEKNCPWSLEETLNDNKLVPKSKKD